MLRLKGRMVGQRTALPPERQLVAALILQALADALAGDAEAARWMDHFAPEIATVWLGIDPARIAAWRHVRAGWNTTSPAYQSTGGRR